MGALAIIPARSGSKGLRNKNILPLKERPLIHYTIEAALGSNCFEDVLVSTDSLQYKEISESAGAWVPFLRQEDLSNDTAKTDDVIINILGKLNSIGKTYDKFMLLQPTSPLRNQNHIIEAFNLLNEKNANAVVSVCEAEHSPLLCNNIQPDLNMDHFIKKNIRRQDLDTYYRLNGAIYLLRTEYFLQYRYFYHSESYAYIMDKRSSVDIDDIYDFKLAQALLEEK